MAFSDFTGIVHSDATVAEVQFSEIQIGEIFTTSDFGTTWFVKTATNHALVIQNVWSTETWRRDPVYFIDETYVRPVDFTW